MQTVAIVRASWIVLAAAGFLTACDKSPTGPAPAPRTEPTIVGLKPMGGPELLQVGETARYSVMAIMSDRSERDVTNEAQWSGGEAVAISGPGLVTGRAPGVAELAAVFGGQRMLGRVTVLPAGTYRLTGQVHETDDQYPWQGVAGARIDVTSGTGAGLSTVTDGRGAYRLDGVAGEATLQVTKDGYQSVELKFGVAFHRTYDIGLPLLAPRADVSGTYTLTITASDECGVGVGGGHVPEEARIRMYTAAVRQDGAELRMTLSGATFRDRGGHLAGNPESDIFGRVEPGRVTFFFPWGDGNESPYILERLLSSRFLFVAGNVVVAGSANRLTGTLDGQLSVYETENVFQPALAWCYTTSHRFVLSR